MKRNIAILGLSLLLLSVSSCGTVSNTSNNQISDSSITEQTMTATREEETGTETNSGEAITGSYTAAKPSEHISLSNYMTDYELASITKRHFSLLDEQLAEPEVKIGNVIVTKEATISLYDKLLESGVISEEEYSSAVSEAEDYSYRAALMNGVPYSFFVPPDGYDGGRLVIDDETTFDDKEDFFDSVADDYCKSNGFNKEQTDKFIRQTRAVFDAVINSTYTKLPDRYENYDVPFANISDYPYTDFRSSWEFDSDALAEIRAHIDEYLIYDEQLGIPFLVHVTLPPDYDAAKNYPVFLMTDGVWRLNDHAALWQAMENGESGDTILVSLAYTYNINGTEDQFRDMLFIENREMLLNFITDDLMPYLGEQYNIDYADSTLFGHSMGGVFSHYACFISDKYENQPFFRYIIGSPAMFNLYGADTDYNAAGAESEYGYFERHETLDKKLFLCGGSLEDPDYANAYHGHDSLLTGLSKMKDRISMRKADFTYKLYESHHYQSGKSDIDKITYSLSLNSGTSLNVFIKAKDNYKGSVKVTTKKGNSVTSYAAVKQADGRYKVTIPDISAHQLGDMYTVTAETTNGTATCSLSALSYVYAVLNGSSNDKNAKNAVSSLYIYYDATLNYRSKA